MLATRTALELAAYVVAEAGFGADLAALKHEDLGALERGLAKLQCHVHNVTQHDGMPCVVAVNRFTHDTDAEHALRRERLAGQGVSAVLVRHWAAGGRGAADLAREVVRLCERPNRFAFVYEDSDSPWEKMHRLPVCSEPRRALRVRRAQFSRPD